MYKGNRSFAFLLLWILSLVLFLSVGCEPHFLTTTYTLIMAVDGQGSVNPSIGVHHFKEDTVVTITATPSTGWEFKEWVGEVANKDSAMADVLMDKDKTIRAIFTKKINPGTRKSFQAGSVFFSMRFAPAATFPIGTDDRDSATVHQSFWISETLVTYELWYTVRVWALNQGYTFANPGGEGSDGRIGFSPSTRKKEPVTRANWHDSIVWCNALSEYLGYEPVYTFQGSVLRDSTKTVDCNNAVQERTKGFRLPTGHEWELAARYKGNNSSHGAIFQGGLYWTPGSYASGATASYQNESATREVAWYNINRTRDVGLKRDNALGLYDMSGNVYEWCFTKRGSDRIARGGAWFCWYATWMQLGLISYDSPDYASEGIFGIRLVQNH